MFFDVFLFQLVNWRGLEIVGQKRGVQLWYACTLGRKVNAAEIDLRCDLGYQGKWKIGEFHRGKRQYLCRKSHLSISP